MTELVIKTARILMPLLQPMRYKAAYGGRGSMKSHFFAEHGVFRALKQPGFRMVCIREVQKSLKESAKRLIEDKIEKFQASESFNITQDHIDTPGGGIILFQGMQDHTAESIKSLEGFDVAWCEEAQTMSAKSLEYLRPTIRKDPTCSICRRSIQECLCPPQEVLIREIFPESELWFSWNPRHPTDPVDKFFRGQNPPKNSVIVRTSFEANPWFPQVMEDERLHDRKNNPHRYAHTWLGEYEPTAIGAIWDRQVIHENRVDEIPENVTVGRTLVGVDPAISAEEGSNEHGIIVAGVGSDNRGYVLADWTTTGNPKKWAQRAIAAYDRYEADGIVIEINQGGDMVKHTIQSERPNIRIIEVRATKGKHVRAEPIAALYHSGKVSHVGQFIELEDQMVQMTAAGYEGEGSPDRVDALVWCLTELFPKMLRKPQKEVKVIESHSEGAWMG